VDGESQAPASGRSDELARDLREFQSSLELRLGLLDRTRSSLNVYLSQDLNVFNYIDPDENRISQVIADLLNPRGPHGQGKIFLDAFLLAIKHGELMRDSEHARVRCQTPTIASIGGFIDITVELPGFCIGIENKPWAAEQPNQLERYREHLDWTHKGRFCLVLLEGRRVGSPSSINAEIGKELEAAGRFRTLQYMPDLKKWIDGCIRDSQSDKLRWFLRDFAAYLDRNFFADEAPGL
jgi:hypothetical protein